MPHCPPLFEFSQRLEDVLISHKPPCCPGGPLYRPIIDIGWNPSSYSPRLQGHDLPSLSRPELLVAAPGCLFPPRSSSPTFAIQPYLSRTSTEALSCPNPLLPVLSFGSLTLHPSPSLSLRDEQIHTDFLTVTP